MRQVAQIMGMPVTIDIPQAKDNKVFEAAFELLRKIDERFSTYKPNSEASRFARGDIVGSDLSLELKSVIKACKQAEAWTEGYFSPWASGGFDPSGYVKGWAIDKAGKLIEKASSKTYCIYAGGDILASAKDDKVWNIGIQDPLDKQKILNVLRISSGAVATSGTYERGSHIINPKTRLPANELLSFTVTGPNIIEADILATAGFAAGKLGVKLVEGKQSYEALAVNKDGSLAMSKGMREMIDKI